MHIYRVNLELLDYIFYATIERGKVYETSAFVHNYALAYALCLARSSTYTYAQSVQKPHYVEELTPLNNSLYLTPAAPQRVAYRLVQWNTLREAYAFPSKPLSLGYPDWGFARMLRPGSLFTFYLMIRDSATLPDAPALRDLLASRSTRVRLGKFHAKVRLQLEEAKKIVEQNGPFSVDTYLNWRDLDVEPLVCDVVATSLPTRLLSRAQFASAPHYKVYFGESDVVCLPAQMRFLARFPAKSTAGENNAVSRREG